MVSNRTLVKVAVIGGFFTVSSGVFVNWKIQQRIRSSEYFKLAMKNLRTHKGAVSLLGEPIKMGFIDLGKTDINFCDGQSAQFQVPVKGPNNKGTVFFWARKDEKSCEWVVDRLELELKDDDSRRLIINKVSEGE